MISISRIPDFITNFNQYAVTKSGKRDVLMPPWDIGKGIVEKQDQFGWSKSIVEVLANELQNEFEYKGLFI